MEKIATRKGGFGRPDFWMHFTQTPNVMASEAVRRVFPL